MISDFLSRLRDMIHLAGIPNYQKGAGIKLPITGAEAKVYATLKSDTIMVIVVYTDSHAD